MQKTLTLASAALAFALAAVTPVLAQDAAPTPPAPQAEGAPPAGPQAGGPKGPKGPHGMRGPQGAEIRLDFGAGRKVAIDCAATPIDACITAAGPLIDKVAASEPVPFGGHDRERGDRKKD